MLLLVIASAGAADSSTIHARLQSDQGWSLHAESEGVRVYKKDIPELGLPGFKGVKVIDADVDVGRLYEIIQDVGNQDKVNTMLYESKVLGRDGDRVDFVQVMDSPPLISDRYWFNSTTEELNIDGVEGHHRRSWSPYDPARYPEEFARVQSTYPDAVHIDMTFGSWELQPQADGTTLLVYTTVSHPGGNLSPSLFSTVTGKTLPNNLLVFEKAAKTQ
jgi:hypothetical protein